MSSLKSILENLFHNINHEPLNFQGVQINYSFSYGLSEFPKESSDYYSLLKNSDLEMYTFKKDYYKKLLNRFSH